jgi:hypothetical protein
MVVYDEKRCLDRKTFEEFTSLQEITLFIRNNDFSLENNDLKWIVSRTEGAAYYKCAVCGMEPVDVIQPLTGKVSAGERCWLDW